MKKRKGVLFALSFILISGGIVHAFSIPGVTRPFDPADYYSETSISYPDSTYTPFTMHDLAANGYRVKDVTRGKKNIISDIKTYIAMSNAMQYIQNKILNLTGLSAEQSSSVINSLQSISEQTDGIHQNGAIPDVDAQNVFQTVQNVGDPSLSFDRKTQIIWMDNMYQNILSSAKNNLADSNEQTEALLATENASSYAEGSLSAMQANTEALGLQATAILRRNALLSNYITLETVNNRADTADKLQSAQDMKNGMTFIVSDPYHPSEQEKVQYSRPEGIGFVKFQ